MQQRIRGALWIERGSSVLAGIGAGLVLSVLGNMLSQPDSLYLVQVLGGLAVVFWLIAIIIRRRWRHDVAVKFDLPVPLRTPEDCADNARRAFVGFVPLYTPREGCSARNLTVAARNQAVANLDFDTLCLEESNMQPTILAITAHSPKLEHCWLLSTREKSGIDSLRYAHLLEEYLRQRKGLQCEFHLGKDCLIEMTDDVLIFQQTYKRVSSALLEAHKRGIKPHEIIADYSTGTRAMAIGMILACLSEDQDVEYVSTDYDDQGKPTGEMFPLIFRFKPTLDSL